MRTKDVKAHFGGAKATAAALGITRAAVYMWGDIVPKVRAYDLERITGGALKVDPSLYPAKPRKTPESIVA